MISDVLHDAVQEIDEYLGNQKFNRIYFGDLRERDCEAPGRHGRDAGGT
jgi:hypothetical protein